MSYAYFFCTFKSGIFPFFSKQQTSSIHLPFKKKSVLYILFSSLGKFCINFCKAYCEDMLSILILVSFCPITASFFFFVLETNLSIFFVLTGTDSVCLVYRFMLLLMCSLYIISFNGTQFLYIIFFPQLLNTHQPQLSSEPPCECLLARMPEVNLKTE